MFQLNGLKTVSGSSYINWPSFKVSKFETTIILSTYVLIIYFSFFCVCTLSVCLYHMWKVFRLIIYIASVGKIENSNFLLKFAYVRLQCILNTKSMANKSYKLLLPTYLSLLGQFSEHRKVAFSIRSLFRRHLHGFSCQQM